MCLSPTHFHRFLYLSIENHYEGPAKNGMIVEIQGHPKHLLMPNCLGIVKNVPQTITIFVGVRIFLWAYIVCPYKISCGRTWAYMCIHGRTCAYMGVHCTPTKNCWDFFCGRTCTPMYAHGRTIMWAYKFFMGVQCTPMYAHGRTGRTGCNLWAYWAYMGVQGRIWA